MAKKDKRKVKKVNLIKKLLKSVVVIVALLALSLFMLFVSFKYSKNKKIELDNLIKQIEETKIKTNEMERKAMLTKTYLNTWNNTITEKQKEKDGIDIESIKQFFTNIANRYIINNLNISFSLPADVQYPGKESIIILCSDIDITFDCLTEYDVYHFLSDIYKNNTAFFVVEELEIRKTKNITKDFIKNLINEGKKNSVFNVKIRIHWYEFSNK